MKRRKAFLLMVVMIAGFGQLSYAQEENEHPSRFSAGILTGYSGGYGIQTSIMVKDFAEDFPFGLRFGLGYNIFNPGNAGDARRIFINNATNGVPEKNGGAFDYRLDFLLKKSFFNTDHSYLVFGPRYSTFKGNFKFIGGNEDFDVKAQQWGVGIGIENHFKVSSKFDIVLAYGLDYYFPNTLKGHDTNYSPDNDNVNPRNDNENDNVQFTFKNADKAINQPKFMPRAMIGVEINL